MIDIWPWWNEFKFGLSKDLERDGSRHCFWRDSDGSIIPWLAFEQTLLEGLPPLFSERCWGNQAKNEKPSQSAHLFGNNETRDSRTQNRKQPYRFHRAKLLYFRHRTWYPEGKNFSNMAQRWVFVDPCFLSSIIMGPNSGQWRSKGTDDCHLWLAYKNLPDLGLASQSIVKISPSKAGGAGSVPGQRIRFPHASRSKTNRSNTVTNSLKDLKATNKQILPDPV